jgi:L-ascorbate metabolism protein UlaG (beta-lactamase superfamily)
VSPTITASGCARVEIEAGGRRLLVDPYRFPTELGAHYICISHDGCPTDLALVDPSKITVLYPKYTREPGIVHPGPTELELDGFRVETIDSSERPPSHRPDPDTPWRTWDGRFVGNAELPANGYVITETGSGTTFYHPGDLGEVFDPHRELRDRIDVMLFPIGKLAGLELTIVEAIRPRRIVPIHCRRATSDFSILLHLTQDATGAKPKSGTPGDASGPEAHRMMEAHPYATPDPPLGRFESITPELERLGAEITILQAGKPYRLPPVASAA